MYTPSNNTHMLQCERTTALESLHRLLFEDPVKIAIMGSGCSPATEPTAEIDHYYNLTHVRMFVIMHCTYYLCMR